MIRSTSRRTRCWRSPAAWRCATGSTSSRATSGFSPWGLAFAACGKDPGFTPQGLLDQAGRSSHYSEAEVRALDFEGSPPDAAALGRQWHAALAAAGAVVRRLPVAHAGEAVLTSEGHPFTGLAAESDRALSRGEIRFHAGRLGGAPSSTRDRCAWRRQAHPPPTTCCVRAVSELLTMERAGAAAENARDVRARLQMNGSAHRGVRRRCARRANTARRPHELTVRFPERSRGPMRHVSRSLLRAHFDRHDGGD